MHRVLFIAVLSALDTLITSRVQQLWGDLSFWMRLFVSIFLLLFDTGSVFCFPFQGGCFVNNFFLYPLMDICSY